MAKWLDGSRCHLVGRQASAQTTSCKMETQLPLQFSAHICCGQMAGWIKMPLGREVGLSPSYIVLDRDSAPSPKRGAEPPIFDPCLLWPDGCMDQDATWHGSRSRSRLHCVSWGPSSPPRKGTAPQFSAHIYCGQTAGWMKIPLGTEVDLSPRHIVLDGNPAPPAKGAQQPPSFRPISIVATVAHFSYC